MSYFFKNRWWSIAFMILLVANISTLIFLWVVKEVPTMPPAPPTLVRPGGIATSPTFLEKELNFSSSQQKEYDELFRSHQEQVKALRDSIHEAKNYFFSLVNINDLTEGQLKREAAKGAMYQQQLDMATLEHFRKVKAICTPEQQKKFDKVIQDVLQRIVPPPPPPPPTGRVYGEDNAPKNPPPPKQ